MNPHLQRGVLLFQQDRHELAAQELRQALAFEPQDAYAHALLGLCLGQSEQFDEATRETQQAIHLAPDFPFAHYALASVLRDRHRLPESLAAIEEGLRLNPEDADYAALLSQIRLDQRNWPEALAAAERGLEHDPEHITCTNLRAIALVRLGRKSEAGATIDAALARNPDNAVTHANQGWTYLEQRNPTKALEHFREALRLDPTNDWARAGIVEALKARNIIYGLMLRYFLWMAKLPAGARWGVIVGGWFLNQMLGGVAKSNPDLAPWILPVRILYLVTAVLTWTADPLFNLMLRVNKFGRLALSEEQTRASSWLGATVFLALVSLALCVVYGFNSIFVLWALVLGLLVLPVAGMFKASKGWPRVLLMCCTAGLALTGIAALTLGALGDAQPGPPGRELRTLAGGALTAFLGGFVIFMLGAIFIIPIRPKR